MDELISVILPVYNGEKYLKKSIDSILKQTYSNFELIIINDGSSDKSHSIINKYLKLNKIKYVSRKNKGLAFTLNEAILLSKGSYIARMDQDDICYPQRLEKQLNFIKKNKLDICGSSYEEINELGETIKRVDSFNDNFDVILSAMMVPFIHPSVMYRNFFNEKKLKYGNIKKTEAEDYDLWTKMISCGLSFGNSKEILIKYRVLKTSMSSVNKVNIFVEVYNNCKNYNKEHKDQLIKTYRRLRRKKISNQFAPILCKSILNFIKANGLNFFLINFIFKMNLSFILRGFLRFLKQECYYFYYKIKSLKSMNPI
tara:strand:+ start:783 stop:1721 length:939 start_codon:yes stop_codon:yes gene_type:complete